MSSDIDFSEWIGKSETEHGMVSAYRLQEDELVFINTVSTGGALPCHLAATLDWIAVANYSSGNLATFALRDGALGERIDFVQHTGAVSYTHLTLPTNREV